MTGVEPTLLDVVRVLSETYTDAGVMTWLTSKNRQLQLRSGERFCTPCELIEFGRTAEVYEAACRIEGFDPAAELRATAGETAEHDAALREPVQLRVAIDTAIAFIGLDRPRTAREYLLKVLATDPVCAQHDMTAEERKEAGRDTW